MSKKKNTKRTFIGLVSKTGHRIYTTVNKQNIQQKEGTVTKFRKRAYDPIARTHLWFEETKKNLGRNEIKPRKN